MATRLVPLFHGLYRALSSVPFAWTIVEFAHLATAVSPLVGPAQTIRRLNDALLVLPEQQGARAQGGRATRRKPKKPTIRPKDEEDDNHSEGSVDTFFSGGEDADEEDEQDRDLQGGFTYVNGKDDVAEDSYQYRQALLKHYRRVGRPLSGHFVLCGGLELLSAVLAQVLAVRAKPPIQDFSDYQKAKLDLDQIDPSRRADGDALDIPGVDTVSSHPGHHHSLPEQPSLATTRAWSALLRTAVSNFPKDKAEEQIQTNGQDAPNQTAGSRILNALPIIGINNGSAAFGQDEGPQGVKTSDDVAEAIASILHASSRAYHDLQRFVSTEGQKQSELFVDVYALEILSEALKLSALCSVAQARIVGSPMDSHVLVRVRNLLSEQAPVYEPLVQGAALQSVGVLVHNFPAIALPMSQQLRRFVTSPLAMFEPEPKGGATISPVLASAAKCLATCVKVAPGDDLVVSTMYSLLNYLGKDAATGGLSAGGAAGSGVSVRSGASRALTGRDHATGVTHSNSSGHFATRSEEQKRLINTSTISMVSRLALEVRSPDVTALTVSMLLQRLRTADPLAEAAILSNLVPMALAAPKALYVDVVRALTQVSRNALTGGASRRGTAAVQAAQLKLARSLGRLNERDDTDRVQPAQKGQEVDETEGGRKEIFLVELLQLFADKGMQLQTLASSEHSSREETAELNTDLAALIPVIDALLSHNDINPQLEPTTEIVVLFRNMWFLAVLFGYASSQAAHASAAGTDAKQTPQQAQAALVTAALRRIALKTPALVPETAHNYLESDLEYNSVLKREFSHATLDSQRKALAAVIPSHAGEVRSFSYAQVTFLMTTYELECMRSSMGRPSMILWYFVNDGLNTSSLIGCMEAIAQKVIASFIEDLSHQVNDHALDPRVSAEVKNLMLGSCHRFAKVRAVSRTFLDKLIGSFPSLLCDPDLVVTMLEMLTLLRRGCEGEYNDEYSPVYHFHSERANISFDLSDSYVQREEILTQFLERVRSYLSLLMGRAPVELQGILQRYLGTFDDASLPGTAELGKSVAVDFARLMPASARTDSYLPKLGGWRADASSSFVGELSSKSTYLGEMTGIHLALTRGLLELQKDPSSDISEDAVAQCKRQLAHLSSELVSKKATIPFAELRRLLYRGAALIVALPEVSPRESRS